jgi:hypothetical protein
MSASLVVCLALGAGPELAVHTSLVLKVADRVKIADQLVAEGERRGGYFTERSDETVTLKVPAARFKELVSVAEMLGVVVQRNHHAEDVALQLAELRARLRSRQEVLERYFAVIKTANVGQVVSVEREMTRLVQEIEQVKGELRVLEHQVELSTLNVQFQFQDRRPPAADGSSSFAWLNTVNLVSLLEDFAHAP